MLTGSRRHDGGYPKWLYRTDNGHDVSMLARTAETEAALRRDGWGEPGSQLQVGDRITIPVTNAIHPAWRIGDTLTVRKPARFAVTDIAQGALDAFKQSYLDPAVRQMHADFDRQFRREAAKGFAWFRDERLECEVEASGPRGFYDITPQRVSTVELPRVTVAFPDVERLKP